MLAVRGRPDRRRHRAWRQFRYVTLPLLKPAMLVALIFRTLDAFRVFDLIYALTGGGPGTSTEPIALYTFNALLQNLQFGYGSALSVIVFLITFGLAMATSGFSARTSRRRDREARRSGGRRWRWRSWWWPAPFPSTGRSSASFTPEARLFQDPSLLPRQLVLDHYRALFTQRNFWVPIRNSLIVAGTTTAFCVGVGSLCAYALARLQFRGKAPLLGFILAVGMFPQISVVSPLYMLLRSLRLINTYPGLILPYLTFAMPLTVWLLVGFFRQLPAELEEAAMVDGASRLRAFWEVIVPLALPGTGHDRDPHLRVQLERVSLRAFVHARAGAPDGAGRHRAVPREYQVPWGQILAAAVVATAPVTLLVLAFQRRIVQGLTAGAVKG